MIRRRPQAHPHLQDPQNPISGSRKYELAEDRINNASQVQDLSQKPVLLTPSTHDFLNKKIEYLGLPTPVHDTSGFNRVPHPAKNELPLSPPSSSHSQGTFLQRHSSTSLDFDNDLTLVSSRSTLKNGIQEEERASIKDSPSSNIQHMCPADVVIPTLSDELTLVNSPSFLTPKIEAPLACGTLNNNDSTNTYYHAYLGGPFPNIRVDAPNVAIQRSYSASCSQELLASKKRSTSSIYSGDTGVEHNETSRVSNRFTEVFHSNPKCRSVSKATIVFSRMISEKSAGSLSPCTTSIVSNQNLDDPFVSCAQDSIKEISRRIRAALAAASSYEALTGCLSKAGSLRLSKACYTDNRYPSLGSEWPTDFQQRLFALSAKMNSLKRTYSTRLNRSSTILSSRYSVKSNASISNHQNNLADEESSPPLEKAVLEKLTIKEKTSSPATCRPFTHHVSTSPRQVILSNGKHSAQSALCQNYDIPTTIVESDLPYSDGERQEIHSRSKSQDTTSAVDGRSDYSEETEKGIPASTIAYTLPTLRIDLRSNKCSAKELSPTAIWNRRAFSEHRYASHFSFPENNQIPERAVSIGTFKSISECYLAEEGVLSRLSFVSLSNIFRRGVGGLIHLRLIFEEKFNQYQRILEMHESLIVGNSVGKAEMDAMRLDIAYADLMYEVGLWRFQMVDKPHEWCKTCGDFEKVIDEYEI
ncbi:MAG: hypothetical protein M1834_002187 [Cirrosporium novae-zelandiae]|nr:MAG: hypothetical protein M1834_002187 [Cirrosporium novae-zelandiae]